MEAGGPLQPAEGQTTQQVLPFYFVEKGLVFD